MESFGRIGTFTLDRECAITAWDGWTARASGIPPEQAAGRRLSEVLPQTAAPGFTQRLQRVLEEGAIEILVSAFHRSLIPCSPQRPSKFFSEMQQRVTLAPLRKDNLVVGVLITIEDVTEQLEQDREFKDRLREGTEAVRLETAEAVASGKGDPMLLTQALSDRSWRVRRVAVSGLARHGGQEAVEALLLSLRDHHQDPALLNSALQTLAMIDVDIAGPLENFLKSGDVDLRVYAALAFGQLKDPKGIAPLLEALADPEDNVRFQAIESLGRLKAGEAAGRLTEIACSKEPFVAFAAIDALAEIGDAAPVPRILPLLEDEFLRPPAARFLGVVGADAAVEPLVRSFAKPPIPLEVFRALTDIHARFELRYHEGSHVIDQARRALPAGVVPSLIEALSAVEPGSRGAVARVLSWFDDPQLDQALLSLLSDPQLSRDIVEALVKMGRRATPALIARLKSERPEERRAAVVALGRIGDPDSVPALIETLFEEEEFAVLASSALGKIADPRAFEPLLTLIGHSSAAVRQAAIGALSSLGHPDLQGRVSDLLRNSNPAIRESAVRISGYFGYAECFKNFLPLIDDPEERVQRAAIELLPFFEGDEVLPTLQRCFEKGDAAIRASVVRALSHVHGKPAASLLTTALRDADSWVRYYALRSIAYRRDRGASDTILYLAANDSAPPVRAAALEALGQIGSAEAVQTLAQVAQQGLPDLARAAIAALAKLHDGAAREALIALLQAPEAWRRMEAAHALSFHPHSDTVSALLRAARSDQEAPVKTAALGALSGLGDPGIVPALFELAKDPMLRADAIEALGRLPSDEIARVAQSLRHDEIEMRLTAVEVLVRLRHPKASAALRTALTDSEAIVRASAVAALQELGSATDDDAIRRLAETDNDPSVRDAAAKVLHHRQRVDSSRN
jgi:HEAT repeat protein